MKTLSLVLLSVTLSTVVTENGKCYSCLETARSCLNDKIEFCQGFIFELELVFEELPPKNIGMRYGKLLFRNIL